MNDDRLTAIVVKRLLDESAENISPDIQARLNLAVSKAVQLHAEKHAATPAPKRKTARGAMPMGMVEQFMNWFNRPALSMAVSACFVGAAALGVAQFGLEDIDAKVSAMADLDAAILSDDLPPDAYLDSGFINYTRELQNKNQVPAEENIDQWLDALPDATTSI
ncbi:MAG TPA: DUF3619 family protein [Limnobacter sp.]|nr:DUF3619 family protein [Limnobacter sp.]